MGRCPTHSTHQVKLSLTLSSRFYIRLQLGIDSNFRNIIKLLVKEKPILLWETLSRFFEIATPSETHYLEALIGSPKHTSDGESHHKEGVLFGISDAECREWAKVAPEIRAPFLCIFYPVLDTNKAGASKWHPALEKLTNEFGTVQEFRQALENRLYPSTWSGSIIPYLETYLIPLKTWFKHPIPEMSFWAREMYRSLERQIDRERN